MPRHADHDQRRREIAYAVWWLLATRGPAAVTVRAVAAEAGMSVGLVQHYFPSKEAMLRDACREMIDQAATRHAASTAADDPLGTLRTLVGHALPATETARIGAAAWYAYLTLSRDDPVIAELLRDAKAGGDAEAVRLLGRARAAGQLDVDVELAARRLMAVADGLALRVFVGVIPPADAVAQLEVELDTLTARP